jgi:Domain of unknown function (DUF6429)
VGESWQGLRPHARLAFHCNRYGDVRMDTENDRIDKAVLALMWLNLDTTGMAWKGFDWHAMARLHERGLISSPVGKSKSVQLTADGLHRDRADAAEWPPFPF